MAHAFGGPRHLARCQAPALYLHSTCTLPALYPHSTCTLPARRCRWARRSRRGTSRAWRRWTWRRTRAYGRPCSPSHATRKRRVAKLSFDLAQMWYVRRQVTRRVCNTCVESVTVVRCRRVCVCVYSVQTCACRVRVCVTVWSVRTCLLRIRLSTIPYI